MRSTKIIACIFSTDDGYGQGVAHGVARYTREHPEYRGVVTAPTSPIPDNCIGALARVYTHEDIEQCKKRGVTTIVVSTTHLPSPFSAVQIDDAQIGRMAADYYLNKGFRRFIGMSWAWTDRNEHRTKTFGEHVMAAGAESYSWMIADENELHRKLAELSKPVALFCWNDKLARWVLECVKSQGLDVPGDVAVLGVDNDLIQCGLAPVDISSIEIDPQAVGYRACELLVSSYKTPHAEPVRLYIPPKGPVERVSTNTIAYTDAAISKAFLFINRNIARVVTVPEVAAAAGLARRTLERRMREQTGRSIREEIVRARLMYARDLLVRTREPIATVAEMSGFNEYRYFLRAFRTAYGSSPRAFRKENNTLA
ncbi:MAG: substrate-binding domain-containing protein [Verrucomicrobiota bacterium]|nr:substrate-binding domain-containing protein [Verrucomicrobiota bacterium]